VVSAAVAAAVATTSTTKIFSAATKVVSVISSAAYSTAVAGSEPVNQGVVPTWSQPSPFPLQIPSMV
jgi:hypothetical protein